MFIVHAIHYFDFCLDSYIPNILTIHTGGQMHPNHGMWVAKFEEMGVFKYHAFQGQSCMQEHLGYEHLNFSLCLFG